MGVRCPRAGRLKPPSRCTITARRRPSSTWSPGSGPVVQLVLLHAGRLLGRQLGRSPSPSAAQMRRAARAVGALHRHLLGREEPDRHPDREPRPEGRARSRRCSAPATRSCVRLTRAKRAGAAGDELSDRARRHRERRARDAARRAPRRSPSSSAALTFLATTASTAPFIGLFGTVWGIMNAFRGLSSTTQSSSIQAVAPGIAEALIATAIGLAAAIPAVVAYNHFARQVRVLARRDGQLRLRVPQHRRAALPQVGEAVDGLRQRQRRRRLDLADQRHAAGRRDAGAARHLHGDGADPAAGRAASTCRRRARRPLDGPGGAARRRTSPRTAPST